MWLSYEIIVNISHNIFIINLNLMYLFEKEEKIEWKKKGREDWKKEGREDWKKEEKIERRKEEIDAIASDGAYCS